MANIECPKCNHMFEGSALKGTVAATAGAIIGAKFGAGMGIATGGTAFAATIPLAIGGGLMGYFSSQKFYKCDLCNKFFKL